MLSGDRWDGVGLDVETSNGGVNLTIPEGYNADLTTRTVNGGFRTDFPMTIQGELSPRHGISTTLGSGGAPGARADDERRVANQQAVERSTVPRRARRHEESRQAFFVTSSLRGFVASLACPPDLHTVGLGSWYARAAVKKLLAGCLVVLVLGVIVAVVGGYFLYRAASPMLQNARNYLEGMAEAHASWTSKSRTNQRTPLRQAAS